MEFLYLTSNALSNFIEKDATLNTNLLHYTNLEAMRGILTSQELWLTTSHRLNDKHEIGESVKQICNCICDIQKRKNSKKQKIFWEKLKTCIRKVQKGDDKLPEFFSASFCTKINDSYVWEEYGDHGKGVMIEFKKDLYTHRHEIFENNILLSSGKVYYEFNKKLKRLCINLLEKINDTLLLKNCISLTLEVEECLIRETIARLLPIFSLIKKNHFKREREYRIYGISSKNDNKKSFKFDLNNIEKIWIGPCANFEETKNQIKRLLSDLKNKDTGDAINASHIEIVRSDIQATKR